MRPYGKVRSMSINMIAKMLIYVIVLSVITIMGLALYGIFKRPSLIKKIIALTIFTDAANTFAIIVGYRLVKGYGLPVPPVLQNYNPSPEYISRFVSLSVDPLPQALVLTAIVISLAVTAFLVALTLQTYRVAGSTDVRVIAQLRAKEEV